MRWIKRYFFLIEKGESNGGRNNVQLLHKNHSEKPLSIWDIERWFCADVLSRLYKEIHITFGYSQDLLSKIDFDYNLAWEGSSS